MVECCGPVVERERDCTDEQLLFSWSYAPIQGIAGLNWPSFNLINKVTGERTGELVVCSFYGTSACDGEVGYTYLVQASLASEAIFRRILALL